MMDATIVAYSSAKGFIVIRPFIAMPQPDTAAASRGSHKKQRHAILAVRNHNGIIIQIYIRREQAFQKFLARNFLQAACIRRIKPHKLPPTCASRAAAELQSVHALIHKYRQNMVVSRRRI